MAPADDPMGWIDDGYAGRGDRVLILGDSVTHASRAEIHRRLAHRAVRIAAVQGEGFSPGPIAQRLGLGSMVEVAEAAVHDHPAVVVIVLGVNDAWDPERDLAGADAGLTRMVEIFTDSRSVMVTVVEAPPAEEFDPAVARGINRRMVELGDAVAPWAARVASDPERYVIDDGIHPTGEGRQLLADLIGEAVDAHLG